MKTILYLSLGVLLLSTTTVLAQSNPLPRYVIARIPTPVLNTPHVASVLSPTRKQRVVVDDCGFSPNVEYIALPKTVFTVLAQRQDEGHLTYKVTTADYPYPSTDGYYVDSRFVYSLDFEPPPPRLKNLPSKQSVVRALLEARGVGYVSGGNVKIGVSQISIFFPTPRNANANAFLRQQRLLQGVDSAGLLHQATNGFTPRYSTALLNFGQPVSIEGKTTEDIVRKLRPLDLIIWKGHLVIVVDHQRVLETLPDADLQLPGCQNGGLQLRPLEDAVNHIMATRAPVDRYTSLLRGPDQFVVRRWYP